MGGRMITIINTHKIIHNDRTEFKIFINEDVVTAFSMDKSDQIRLSDILKKASKQAKKYETKIALIKAGRNFRKKNNESIGKH